MGQGCLGRTLGFGPVREDKKWKHARFCSSNTLIGIGFGLGAAVLYATVVILNKFIKDESINLMQIAGGMIILGFTLLNEIQPK